MSTRRIKNLAPLSIAAVFTAIGSVAHGMLYTFAGVLTGATILTLFLTGDA